MTSVILHNLKLVILHNLLFRSYFNISASDLNGYI